MMKISAGISDIKFRGKIRCVLHMVDVLPLLGSVEIMLLDPPSLDFDLNGAANVLDMPGLHGMIRQVATDAITQQMVYPNRLTIVTCETCPAFQMLAPKPLGVVRITIIEAANLPQTDFGGLFAIDPYCVVQVGSKSKSTKKTSGNNPVWNEEFDFPIEYCQSQMINIDVFDSDKLSEDENLGSVSIDVEHIKENHVLNEWYDLGNCGKLRIKIIWTPIIVEEEGKENLEVGKSMILSLFMGKLFNRKYKEEKLVVKLEIESEKDKVVSKCVEQDDDGFVVFNEGFMLMMKKREKKFLIKIFDVQNNTKIGQEYVTINNCPDDKVQGYKIDKVLN